MKYVKFIKLNLFLGFLFFVYKIHGIYRVDTIRVATTFFIDKICPLLVDALTYLQTAHEVRNQGLENLEKHKQNNVNNHTINFSNFSDLNRMGLNSLSSFTQKTILALSKETKVEFDRCVSDQLRNNEKSICPDKTNSLKSYTKTECLPSVIIENSSTSKNKLISCDIPKTNDQLTNTTKDYTKQVLGSVNLSKSLGQSIVLRQQIAEDISQNLREQTAIPIDMKATVHIRRPRIERVNFTQAECSSYIENLDKYLDIILKTNSQNFLERIVARFNLFELRAFQGLVDSQTQNIKTLTDSLIDIYFGPDGNVLLEPSPQATKIILKGLRMILSQPETMNAYKLSQLKLSFLEEDFNILKEKKLYLNNISEGNIPLKNSDRNLDDIQVKSKNYSNVFYEELRQFDQFLESLDYTAAKNYSLSADSIFQKKLRLTLLNEYFTSEGFLKKCLADPLYKELTRTQRAYISSDINRLKTFNQLLTIRYVMLLQNANLFIFNNTNNLLNIELYLQTTSYEMYGTLYKLVDCVNDRCAQIDVLIELFKNKNLNEELYREFFNDGLLKICQYKFLEASKNDYLKNSFYQSLYNQYCLAVKNSKDFELIRLINKLAFLDFSCSSYTISKVREYVFCNSGKNTVKVDSIESKLYLEYSKTIIDALFDQNISKEILINIPELSKVGSPERINNLQFIAHSLDKLTNNKHNQLKRIRAFILTENTSMHPYSLVNAYLWVESLKCSPISKLKAKECLEGILACQITNKNIKELSEAIYHFDQASKSNNQIVFDDHLNKACQKLDEVQKRILILNQDIEKEKVKYIENPTTEPDKEKSIDVDEKLDKKLKEAKFIEKKIKATLYEKPGDFSDAVKDFEELDLSDIKPISNGKMGKLKDGRIVNARSKSKDKRPTLEIYDPNKKKSIKFRYDKGK